MDKNRLEERIGVLLKNNHLTIALAESCTGGLVANRITNISGSSDYFQGGVVSYSNEAKEKMLGVKSETLIEFGAVSEKTALEMAHGARHVFGTDIALAITGIAGPTGGTPEKPVGLTYIAIVAPEIEKCECHIWSGNRLENKTQSADAALHLLLDYLEEMIAK